MRALVQAFRQGTLARAVAAGAALATLAAGLPAASAEERATRVRAERVELAVVTETTPVLAEIVATTESAVAARTAGLVDEVLFRVGDRVEAGQPLVRLESDLIEIRRRTAMASLAAARAGVEVAEAQLRLATQAFERTAQLQGSTAFSRGQFDDLRQQAEQARSELARSEAQVGQAEAELARADYDLEHSTIRAPFSGVVVSRAAQPGSYISLGEPVGVLLDSSAMEIEVNLPVRFVGAIAEGSRIGARVDGGVETEAVVRSILPVETASTRTRPVRLSVDLEALSEVRLAAGSSVTLDMPVSAPRRAVTVPKDALVQHRGGWTVFTVEDGRATQREIRVGQPDGARLEVLSGLLPGEIVVVRGNERLRPGQPIEALLPGDGGTGAASGSAGEGSAGAADPLPAETGAAPAEAGSASDAPAPAEGAPASGSAAAAERGEAPSAPSAGVQRAERAPPPRG